jgi:hypothetical protein
MSMGTPDGTVKTGAAADAGAGSRPLVFSVDAVVWDFPKEGKRLGMSSIPAKRTKIRHISQFLLIFFTISHLI